MQYYQLIENVAGVELITLAEAKKQLKMEDLGTFDDELIQECIDAAIGEVENYANIVLRQAKYKISTNSWSEFFESKVQYVTSLDKLSYRPSGGGATVDLIDTALTDFVETLQYNKLSTFRLLDYDNRPNLLEKVTDSVTMEVTVGYTAATLPKPLKQAIKLLLTDNYNFRNTRTRTDAYKDSSRILIEPYKFYTNGRN